MVKLSNRPSVAPIPGDALRTMRSAARSRKRKRYADTDLSRIQIGTLHCLLLKVGADGVRNNRRIRSYFSTAFPHLDLFVHFACRLASRQISSSAPWHVDKQSGLGGDLSKIRIQPCGAPKITR
jgi:hypothetical protein